MNPVDVGQVSQKLRALPKPHAPSELVDRLRVLASREASRRRSRSSLSALFAHLRSELFLRIDNLMKPVAVPFAGGIISALLLFAALAPSLAVPTVIVGDIPTNLSTQATLASSLSFQLSDDDIVVDVSIDERGRITDYTIPSGQAWAQDANLVRSLENTLLLTKFTPATMFGQPASGKTRITLRRSQMEVRG
jgi:hypothetical protein